MSPPTIYYVENEDGSLEQALHLGPDVFYVPIVPGSDGEAFMRRVGVKIEREDAAA